jgi:hypothetical protein
MTTITKLTDGWATKTWHEQLKEVVDENSRIAKELRKVLEKYEMLDDKVTGKSVTGLRRTEETRFLKGLKISFSEAFQRALGEDPKLLPALYLKNIASNFDFEKASSERFEGVVCRGLRTFPSLLRERDFGENLSKVLNAQSVASSKFTITIKPEEDISGHTDVLLDLFGTKFRIWLYQFTPNGIPHDTERLLGKRKELPVGFHLLCPILTDVAQEKETLEQRLHWLEARLAKKELKYQSYKKRSCRGAAKCFEEKSKIGNAIERTKTALAEATVKADAELCSVNWWYFYPEKKLDELIRKVIAFTEGKMKPDMYSEVTEILRGPEEYLGEVRFFSK